MSRHIKGSQPGDFDSAACPIITKHFEVGPSRPTGQITAEVVADMRRRRQVEHLHRLGPRATAELLAEIGAERSITTIIDRKLDVYADLDLEALEAAGGDRFWPPPLRDGVHHQPHTRIFFRERADDAARLRAQVVAGCSSQGADR